MRWIRFFNLSFSSSVLKFYFEHRARVLVTPVFVFNLQYYTDKNHGLRGGGTSEHLYHLLTDFLVDGLMLGFS